jgi:hypothetical protein
MMMKKEQYDEDMHGSEEDEGEELHDNAAQPEEQMESEQEEIDSEGKALYPSLCTVRSAYHQSAGVTQLPHTQVKKNWQRERPCLAYRSPHRCCSAQAGILAFLGRVLVPLEPAPWRAQCQPVPGSCRGGSHGYIMYTFPYTSTTASVSMLPCCAEYYASWLPAAVQEALLSLGEHAPSAAAVLSPPCVAGPDSI